RPSPRCAASLCVAERSDQLALPHARATRDVPPLRLVVELRPRPVLEVPTGLAAAPARRRGVPREVAARGAREVGDRPAAFGRGGRLLDVPSCSRDLLPRGHDGTSFRPFDPSFPTYPSRHRRTHGFSVCEARETGPSEVHAMGTVIEPHVTPTAKATSAATSAPPVVAAGLPSARRPSRRSRRRRRRSSRPRPRPRRR